jgi:CHAT domain-containing protein
LGFEAQAQQDSIAGISLVKHYIEHKQFLKAENELSQQIEQFIADKKFDSLQTYPFYLGQIALERFDKKTAYAKVDRFMKRLKRLGAGNRVLMRAYTNLDDFYFEVNDTDKSLEATTQMLFYAKAIKGDNFNELGKANYAVGSSYHAMYNLAGAKKYFTASVAAYEKSNTVPGQILADSYNGVAISNWDLNLLDEAKIAFEKAINAMDKSTLDDYGNLYYLTAFKFNIALVEDDLGNLKKAIEITESVIENCAKIIANSEDEFWVDRAVFQEAIAISNLAAFYHDSGFLSRSLNLHRIAYSKKKKIFGPNHPRSINNLSQIATTYLSLKDFENCLKTCEEVLKNIDATPDDLIYFKASIYHTMGKAHSEMKHAQQAITYYQKSDRLYQGIFPDDPGREYRVFLRDYAKFLAGKNDVSALEKVQKVYNYARQSGGEDNLPILKNMLTMAHVNQTLGQSTESLHWTKMGRDFLQQQLRSSTNTLDSLKAEIYRPELLLVEAQSKYSLADKQNEIQLKEIDSILQSAIAITEQQKASYFESEDISSLITSYRSISEFAKLVNYNLYQITQEPGYVDAIISMHESGIYNRIRNRLNLRKDVVFSGVPKTWLDREKELKQKLLTSINNPQSGDISAFFNANRRWNVFLDSLKTTFPEYYRLRYSVISESFKGVEWERPPNTTILRYFFIQNKLFVYVLNNNSQQLIELDTNSLQKNIEVLNSGSFKPAIIGKSLKKLYDQLWQPIAELVNSQKVIIVPDKELFNLSFELLSPEKISSFKEFQTKSLISHHHISYNYSLFLIDTRQKLLDKAENYVAFAPGFEQVMKQEYQLAIADSIHLDKSYLSLSSLPFSKDLAKKYSRVFDGTSFFNQNASKQIFVQKAKENKIIHIGTHAESNNVSPALSRLVFAKNVSDSLSINDNYLYTYEIYNYDLSSNLAILTACETGKPSYQPGEGMISLAHAFNYAGSESILTSLWEIDEQSSSQIVDLFYEELSNGLPKDEALHYAKLAYLQRANGRALAPQYWAGLVLMGDTTPIDLNTGTAWWFWAVTGLLVLSLLFYLIILKRRNSRDDLDHLRT